jgi:hypothetical protein
MVATAAIANKHAALELAAGVLSAGRSVAGAMLLELAARTANTRKQYSCRHKSVLKYHWGLQAIQ